MLRRAKSAASGLSAPSGRASRSPLWIMLALLALAAPARGFYDVPHKLIAITSRSGADLLDRSWPYNADFFNVSSHLVTQENQAFCGIASMTTLFNALQLPYAPELFPSFPYYTQDNIFSASTERVVKRTDIARRGMEMSEWAAFAASFPGVTSEAHYGNETSAAEFRALCRRVFASSGSHIAINFLRREIGEISGGHWSPVAAYDEQSDRVLIMDVTRFKYPPVWVELDALLGSMNTRDGPRYRGFVVVSYGREVPVDAARPSYAASPVQVRAVGEGGFVATGILSFLGGLFIALGAWWYTHRRAVSAGASSSGAAFFEYKEVRASGSTPTPGAGSAV